MTKIADEQRRKLESLMLDIPIPTQHAIKDFVYAALHATRDQAVRECAEIAASDERSDMAKEHKYQPHWFIHAKRIEQRILSLIDRR
ncbi:MULTISPECIES: hypothetical protein [unclassified Phyllobacterium]|uniref:hypothetical protein n=1 Tax=unclassified Phyllobacterium TaxID=2638441 RepID=UPI0030131363